MTVEQVTASLNQRGQQLGSSLFFPGQDDFATKLTVGQVLKAKVMRHHEGSRYGVSFNGTEKIVDSANPLRPGEVIEGRVKSLGQQVEIQRINTSLNAKPDDTVAKLGVENNNSFFFQGNHKQLNVAKSFFAERQAPLSSQEMAVLKELVGKAYPLNSLILSALSVKKAGVNLSKDAVLAVMKALDKNLSKETVVPVVAEAVALEAAGAVSSHLDRSIIRELSANIRDHAFLEGLSNPDAQMQDTQAQKSHFDSDTSDKEFLNQDLAKWLLNIQDDSAINHRLMTFPIWMGDKLVEIRMAFFDQDKSQKSPMGDDLPYKRVVFTVAFEQLGSVAISAVMHGSHMSLSLMSEESDATEYIARYMGSLKTVIESMGWEIDKLEYSTVVGTEFEPAAHAIVEHYIAKDSVSRLF